MSEFNTSAIGYYFCAVAFVGFLVLLTAGWQGGKQGASLVVATVVTIIWSVLAAVIPRHEYFTSISLAVVELLRSSVWLAFLLVVMLGSGGNSSAIPKRLIQILAALIAVILITELGFLGYAAIRKILMPSIIGFDVRALNQLVFSVTGLIIIEQMFRNATSHQRWNIKFMCLGLGGLFAYDFYLYANALLLKGPSQEIWAARGYINAMLVPLLAVSAARNPDWSFEMHVSRRFVFHTTTMIASGIYLMAMALGGHYIKAYGGSWGGVARLIFLFGALVLLAILMLSGQLRAKLRLYLSKNFFSYRYDYREEWIKFTNVLSQERLDRHLRVRVIEALGDLVESTGGMLWLRKKETHFQLMESVNMATGGLDDQIFDQGNEPLVRYLEQSQNVVDIDDYNREPTLYEGLALPQWSTLVPQAWLIVPMMQQSQLYGFIVLAHSRALHKINWEDRDLLITTGRGATNYLALLDASEALFDARQFEAFNRLSAYVVHDLKNVIAQLALVVKNYTKHKDNPAFVDDAITTVDNAVSKMNRMLAQLRKDRAFDDNACNISLTEIVHTVVIERSVDRPTPRLECCDDAVFIFADKERIYSVISNLVQNAQQATLDSGCVTVRVYKTTNEAVIEIEDTGSGMDKEFIQERLFRPFDTTKGNAGMGIGAYESREFVNSLGGQLNVKSEPGKGTLFSIRLKLVEHQAQLKAVPGKHLSN